MKMALAIIFPPLGVHACGKIGQFFLNLIFCVIGVWIGGTVHAVYVVNKSDADRRHKEMMAVMRANQR